MAFTSGSMSFQRFAVVGQGPKAVDESLLEKLAEFRMEESDIAVPEDEEWGWIGGRHLLDGEFSWENNVYADCLHFGLRVDSNKVPGALKKALVALEEQAAGSTNPSGFATKAQKRDARDAVDRKLHDEKRAGRFRRSKMTTVLWDIPAGILYGPTSISLQEKLFELFDRSFGLSLVPLTSGNLALRRLEGTGKRRDYEDARPTRFAMGPQGESQAAEYPWVAKGPQAKDFLGNEFLLWLWHESETGGAIDCGQIGRVHAMFDKTLDLDCSFGETGRDGLRATGPTRMPEARDALRSGKVPRKAGLILDGPSTYSLSLAGESLAVGALVLPEIEADEQRVLVEERIGHLRDFGRLLDALFDAFLKVRAGSGWHPVADQVRKWVASTGTRSGSAAAAAA